MTALRILVADDHDGTRRGLKELLEARPGWRVVGEAVNGREAIEKAAQLAPDVVILDINMPELDGLTAAPLVHEAVPQAELLVLTLYDFPEMVRKAFDAGARGYVLKSDAARDLVAAVEAVHQHRTFLSNGVRASLGVSEELQEGTQATTVQDGTPASQGGEN